MHTNPGAPESVVLIDAKSADETLSKWWDVRGKAHVVLYVTATGDGVTTSGVVTVEEAAPILLNVDNAPVWGATTDGYSVVTTQLASAVNGGKQIAVHLPVAAYGFVRARISTAIGGGGTITVGGVAY